MTSPFNARIISFHCSRFQLSCLCQLCIYPFHIHQPLCFLCLTGRARALPCTFMCAATSLHGHMGGIKFKPNGKWALCCSPLQHSCLPTTALAASRKSTHIFSILRPTDTVGRTCWLITFSVAAFWQQWLTQTLLHILEHKPALVLVNHLDPSLCPSRLPWTRDAAYDWWEPCTGFGLQHSIR